MRSGLSRRRGELIWSAVADAIMELRIELERRPLRGMDLDNRLFNLMNDAAGAALNAYQLPIREQRFRAAPVGPAKGEPNE